MRKMDNQYDDREAWGYLQNALAVAPELTLLEPKLSSVQALIGMAIVVQGTPNSRPFGTLISQAIRMAQSLGLHRKNRDPSLTPREVEQRKRVFWTAYFIDKEHCLRTGQPPAQDDDALDIEMPSEEQEASVQFGSSPDLNYFTIRVKMALIQGQVYRRLISVKAEKQSVTRRMVEVKRLEGMLAVWRASTPIDFSENYKVPGRGRPLIAPIIHKVILRMNYFNTLNTIHRFSVPVEHWRSQLQQPLDPATAAQRHTAPPPVLCVEEARNAITLMHITPHGDYSCIWYDHLHLLASIYHEPRTDKTQGHPPHVRARNHHPPRKHPLGPHSPPRPLRLKANRAAANAPLRARQRWQERGSSDHVSKLPRNV
jgi:hypothetical protein